MARWASRPIEIGTGNTFTPPVINLADLPEIMDESEACSNPDFATLAVAGHGRDPDASKAARIAAAALAGTRSLDETQAQVHRDLIMASLSEAALLELQAMTSKQTEYTTVFAKRWVTEGKAKLVLRVATLRFGAVSELEEERIWDTSIEGLDLIAEQLLSASSVTDAIDRARAIERTNWLQTTQSSV